MHLYKKKKYQWIFICVSTLFLCSAVFAQIHQESGHVLDDNLVVACSSDEDCRDLGVSGFCKDAGLSIARCVNQEVISVPLYVVVPDFCRTCMVDAFIEDLLNFFPGLDVSLLSVSDPKAQLFIELFDIQMLPAYIFLNEVERVEHFEYFRQFLEFSGEYYYLVPEYSGVSFFLGRPLKENQIDLFLSLIGPGMDHAALIADSLRSKGVSVNVHFIGIEKEETDLIITPQGNREIEENKIYACVEKNAPSKAFGYLLCRLSRIDSLWWKDCLRENRINVKRILRCARSDEGTNLFREKTRLSREIAVFYAPLFLLENVEIFGISGQTTASEIFEIINKK